MPSRPLLQSPEKPVDEKITINLGCIDLGQIDLLVQEGFFANRTDLIRTAIRNQLASHAEALRRTIVRCTRSRGLCHLSCAELEKAVAAGEQLHIRVVGLARIADDVSPEVATSTIASMEVLGAFHASKAVRDALSQRIN